MVENKPFDSANPNKNLNSTPRIEVVSSGEAKWLGGQPKNGIGKYNLKQGYLTVVFPDGSEMKCRGPIQFEIKNSNQGQYLVDLERGGFEFGFSNSPRVKLQASLLRLDAGPTSRVQLKSTREQSELIVKKGEASVLSSDVQDSRPATIRLREGKLDHVLAQRLGNVNRDLSRLKPAYLLARSDSPTEEPSAFEGQVVFDGQTLNLNSADHMTEVLGRISVLTGNELPGFRRNWRQVCERSARGIRAGNPAAFQDFMKDFGNLIGRNSRNNGALQIPRNRRDEIRQPSTPFSGSLIINGRRVEFSDPSSFMDAIIRQ